MKLQKPLLIICVLFSCFVVSCGDNNGKSSEESKEQEAALSEILDCAGGDASSVTIEMLETAGITGLTESSLADYQAAISDAGSINSLAELQALIDQVNSANGTAKWGSAVWGTHKWNQ